MSPMRIIILLIAALAAAGAAFLVRNMSAEAPPPPPTMAAPAPVQVQEIIEVPTTPVLIVTRDVGVGEVLNAVDLEWADWPNENLNVNFYSQEITPEAVSLVENSVVRRAMFENEPILPKKIVKKGDTGYMAALLAPGMRAVTVEISTVTASGGFILPGDRVDVLLSYDVELEQSSDAFDRNQQTITRPTTTVLMENVRILAIDQIFGDASGTFAIGSTATVELPPREARLLVMAKRLGRVSLALRSLRDANEGGPTAARTDFLLDVSPYGDADRNSGALNNRVTIYRQGEVSIEMPSGS